MHKILALAPFLALTAAMTIQSAVPQTVNYRGRLLDASGAPVDTTLAMTFRIYDTPTQGTSLWVEIQTAVVASNGLFTVNLGSVVPRGLVPSSAGQIVQRP